MRDLLPTLCDLAAIPSPDGIDGLSLATYLQGKQPPWREWLHGEHEYGSWSNHWLTDGRMKYAWYSQTGREQLFDLRTDPQECHDLVSEQSEELAEWRMRLIEELGSREEGFVQDGKLVVGKPVAPVLRKLSVPAMA